MPDDLEHFSLKDLIELQSEAENSLRVLRRSIEPLPDADVPAGRLIQINQLERKIERYAAEIADRNQPSALRQRFGLQSKEPKSSDVNECKILFLAANPEGTGQLALNREVREITAKIRAAEHRDRLKLVSAWAVRPDDVLQALNEQLPQIVQFSGHGSPHEELILHDAQDRPKSVSKEALAALFTTLKDNIRLVVLNACYSRPQAEAIVETIDCAVGMSRAIGDDAAIIFAASFYRAIGFGRSVQEAFDQGMTALLLEGVPEETTPQLHIREGVDASDVYLTDSQ